MDATRNKNTYKNSPWIGAQTSLSPLSPFFAHSRCLFSPYILAIAHFIHPFSNFVCINGEKTKSKNMAIMIGILFISLSISYMHPGLQISLWGKEVRTENV